MFERFAGKSKTGIQVVFGKQISFYVSTLALLFTIFVLSSVVFAQSQYRGAPVTKERLSKVLRLKQLSKADIVQVVTRNGVDFKITPAIKNELITAGANAAILAAVQVNFRAAVGKSEASFEKGNELFYGGKYEEALTAYKAVAAQKTSAEAFYNIGNCYYLLKRFDAALLAYRESIKIDSKDPNAWENAGSTLLNLQRPAEALEAYQKVVQIKPDYVNGWLGVSYSYLQSKNYTEAIRYFKKTLDMDALNADAWLGLGDSYYALDRHLEAVESYKMSVSLDQKKFGAWVNLGWTLIILKRYPEAIEASTQAVKLMPDDSNAWNNLGLAYFGKKDYANSVNSYKKAIELDPNNEEAKQGLKDVEDALEDN